MMASSNSEDCCSDTISIDNDVAFAFVDFSGVDFGGHDYDKTKPEPTVGSEEVNCIELKANRMRKDPNLQHEIFPEGQFPHMQQHHDPQLFKAQSRRVHNLCKWYELGIRPSLSSSSLLNFDAHHQKDEDLFANEIDDMQILLLRSIQAQDALNTNLPPFPLGDYEDRLKVAPSTIDGAGNGLFTTVPIPKGAIVCYYTGYRHHYQSQKRLKDRQYIMKLQNGWPKFDRRNDGFIDALPTKDVLARFINDPRLEERCNVAFEHIKEPEIWYCPVVAQRDIAIGEELFVSYGPRYWSEARTIGG
ncbi:hypothetical protein ACHAWU_004291 [Discostella pseudostelligera]|jgi:hypothetical protein|uniref:SET domain-containing protein n=1 Tax=Discostella pseudostelligera TaxID=259834 RepID=A0ABD3M2W1_9STRA